MNEQEQYRLPCRGCTEHCPNYATCNGTPWHKDPAPGTPANPKEAGDQSRENHPKN